MTEATTEKPTKKTAAELRAERRAATMSMYDLCQEIEQILTTIEAADGEVTDEVQKEWDEWKEALEVKAERSVHAMFEAERILDGAKAQEGRFAEIRRGADREIKRIKHFLEYIFRTHDIDKVTTPLGHKVGRQKSSKPKIEWVGKGPPPPEFQRVIPPPPPALDKDLALDAFNAGLITKEDPNWSIEQGYHITVR